jgi:uncharacterized membrane protein
MTKSISTGHTVGCPSGAPREIEMKNHPSRTWELRWLLLACLAACTESAPLDPGSTDAGAGTGESPAEQPAFIPYMPPSAPTAAGGGSVAGTGNVGGGPGGKAGQSGPAVDGGAAGQGGASGQIGTGTAGAGNGGAAVPPPPANPVLLSDVVPVALDDDGALVVGSRQTRALTWTEKGDVVLLPLAGLYDSSVATATSSSGTVVVGSLRAAATSEAVAWLLQAPGATPVRLGFLPGHDSSDAVDVSADGAVVAGTSRNAGAALLAGRSAFISRGGGSMPGPLVAVAPLPGDTASEAVVLSRDGSTLAGYSDDFVSKRQRTFWWREGTSAVEVGAANGATSMVPRALSADGSVLVGDALFGATKFVFRWTRTGGTELAPPPRNRANTRAVGISNDGAAIVGMEFNDAGVQFSDLPVPFRWLPPSNETQNFAPGDLPVATVFTDELCSTIVGLGAGTYSTYSNDLFFWHAPAQIYTPAALAPLPVGSEGVALSRNGRVLLGQGRGSDASPVAWLLPVP